MSFTPTAKDFSLRWDEDITFSFFEDEDGIIFAYDHVDPEILLDEVKIYDKLIYGTELKEDYANLVRSVKHSWAVVVDDGLDGEWRFHYGDSYRESEKAFPITYVSR